MINGEMGERLALLKEAVGDYVAWYGDGVWYIAVGEAPNNMTFSDCTLGSAIDAALLWFVRDQG